MGRPLLTMVDTELLNKDVFKHKQYGQYIHCRGEFLELTAEDVERYIKYHSCENTVGNRIGHRHHYYAGKRRNCFAVVRKIDVTDRLKHQKTY